MNMRRIGLSLGFVVLLTFAYLLETRRARSAVQPLPGRQELNSLYEIFKDEIRSDRSESVYVGLGNELELDGKIYTTVLKALNAYDLLRDGESSEADRAGERRVEEARRAFETLLEELDWPRCQANLSLDRIELSVPERIHAFEKIKQPLLVSVHNHTARSKSLAVSSAGLSLPRSHLTVGPTSTGHLVGFLEAGRSGSSSIPIQIRSDGVSALRKLNVDALPSGILEGRLSEDGVSEPAVARIRTTSGGVYFAPDAHSYGLIRNPYGFEAGREAERWFYVAGKFRVRAPAGKLALSIRRGLEYRPLEEAVEIEPGRTVRREFKLARWIDMEDRGWYSGDTHIHYLDPETALFEMQAEDLHVANVLVMNHYGSITAERHFQGRLDPISGPRHKIYYNEEFRHGFLGHVGLLKLKRLVQPISTGGLGVDRKLFWRVYYYLRPDESHYRRGRPGAPDRLLVEAMRETHRQGGMVNWAHLRPYARFEFALDAALGELDAVDILTNTQLPDALEAWYHMLNCGLRLSATAGTDREGPSYPVGHQRVYAKPAGDFSYASWIRAVREGTSFVTNGPALFLTVNGADPGSELKLSRPENITIRAKVVSQLPVKRLQILINGEVVQEEKIEGLSAEVTLEYPVGESVWIAARVSGPRSRELFNPNRRVPHNVFAHTSPVYVRYRHDPVEDPESGCYLMGYVEKLKDWATRSAFFESDRERRKAMTTIQEGLEFYRRLCGTLSATPK